AGRSYRLPTEAEWEHACRAGTTTVFHCGDSLSAKDANIKAEEPYGAAQKGTSIGKPIKVGSYAPNAWGIYDMHGNVAECGLDSPRGFAKEGTSLVDNPEPDRPSGAAQAIRGGSFLQGAGDCRSAFRDSLPSGYRLSSLGFRVVLVNRPLPRP